MHISLIALTGFAIAIAFSALLIATSSIPSRSKAAAQSSMTNARLGSELYDFSTKKLFNQINYSKYVQMKLIFVKGK